MDENITEPPLLQSPESTLKAPPARIHEPLHGLNLFYLNIACASSCAGVTIVDYLTGYEISFFIFYTFPIWLATWYGGRNNGLIFALLSLIGWVTADYLTHHTYSHPLIPFWNGLTRFIVFAFSAIALDVLNQRLRQENFNADYDALTGLLNIRGFLNRAPMVVGLIRRQNTCYALAFIDLDNFKYVNDTYGHAEGDRILREVSRVMKHAMRTSDFLCRIGGDEFIIMLPGANKAQTHEALTHLQDKLFHCARHHNWSVGFSIGAGIFHAQTPIEHAIKTADTFMYDVKKSGKGHILITDLASQE